MSEILGQWGSLGRGAISILLDFSWQSSVLIALAFGGMKLFRVRGAAARHSVLMCVLLGVSVMPMVNLAWNRVEIPRFSVRTVSEGVAQSLWVRRDVASRQQEEPAEEIRSRGAGQAAPGAETVSTPGTAVGERGDTESPRTEWWRTMMQGTRVWGYTLLFGIWAVGVLLGILRLVWGYRIVRRMKAASRPVEDPCVLAAYEEAQYAVGLRRKPRLLVSEEISAPMAVGIVDPVVLVPDGLGEALSSEELVMVLLHELVHIKWRDLLMGLYQQLLTVIWFFHPLVRYLNRRLSQVCEDRCDGLVLERAHAPVVYARALMELLQRSDGRQAPFPAAAGLHCHSRLAYRVRGVLHGVSPGSMPRWATFVVLLALSLSVSLLSAITVLDGSETLSVMRTVSVSGIVRDPAGPPVEGAMVYAVRGGSWDSWGKAPTGVDGRFEIKELLSGDFTVTAEAEGYAPCVLLDVAGDAEDLELVLSEGGAIEGEIVSQDGYPQAGVMVMAEPQGGDLHGVLSRTDQDGVYTIPHLAAGMYRVRVKVSTSPSVHGKLVVDSRQAYRIVRVREGRTSTGVDFILIPGRSVSGRVTYRETGKPAVGIPVTLMGQDRMDAVTDEEGQYTFSGVPPGHYWMETDKEGYVVPHRRIEVTAVQNVQHVDVVLIRQGTLSVVVGDPDCLIIM